MALTDWSGLISGQRHDNYDELRMMTFVAPTGNTFSGPFRAIANDGDEYFVKVLEACRPGTEQSVVIEFVVAAVGRLIAAPVCDSRLIRIPSLLAGHELRDRVRLQAGLAHGSRAIRRVMEGRRAMSARGEDDNARRHVGVLALYDWCYGADPQWLYDIDSDRTTYSHDHGLYFPDHRGRIDRDQLRDCIDIAHELQDSRSGLLPSAIEEVAKLLEQVSRDSLVGILASVPSSWPVADEDLEVLGWFLEHRAPLTAARIRAIA